MNHAPNSHWMTRREKNPTRKGMTEMKTRAVRMDDGEKITILEAIARDPETPASARVTAIRTLRDYWPQTPRTGFDDLDAILSPGYRVARRSPEVTALDT